METTDLFLAAYLESIDKEMTDFKKISQNKGCFIFDINEEESKKILQEFKFSIHSKIKYCIESLKDLCR